MKYTILVTSIILIVVIQIKQPNSLNNHSSNTETNNKTNAIHTGTPVTAILTTQLKVNKSRPVCKYIFILLLANASDTETNPGPRTPKWPCGTCNKAVNWRHKAICCDNCETWFHIQCQHIQSNVFRFMDASNVSWECLQCGMPNFSTSLFNSMQ